MNSLPSSSFQTPLTLKKREEKTGSDSPLPRIVTSYTPSPEYRSSSSFFSSSSSSSSSSFSLASSSSFPASSSTIVRDSQRDPQTASLFSSADRERSKEEEELRLPSSNVSSSSSCLPFFGERDGEREKPFLSSLSNRREKEERSPPSSSLRTYNGALYRDSDDVNKEINIGGRRGDLSLYRFRSDAFHPLGSFLLSSSSSSTSPFLSPSPYLLPSSSLTSSASSSSSPFLFPLRRSTSFPPPAVFSPSRYLVAAGRDESLFGRGDEKENKRKKKGSQEIKDDKDDTGRSERREGRGGDDGEGDRGRKAS
ncbi:hypothetical protein CSUI_008893, partial [Cystoisospora suis]